MKLMSSKLFALIVVVAFLFTSCTTSSDVVSNRRIQKRKLNKGYFLNMGKNDKTTAQMKTVEEEVQTEEIAEVVIPIQKEETKEAEPKAEAKKVKAEQKEKQLVAAITKKIREKKADKNQSTHKESSSEKKSHKKYTSTDKEVTAKVFSPDDTVEADLEGKARQGVYLILLGLLIELAALIINSSIIYAIGGIVILVGIILIILHLLERI